MSASDSQFQGVRSSILDALSKGNVTNYLALLQSKTNDVDGFLAWSDANPIPDPAQTTAAAAVSRLQSANWSVMSSVQELSAALLDCAPIPFLRDTQRQRQYFVLPRSSCLIAAPDLVAAESGSASSTPVPAGTQIVTHPSFLALARSNPTSGSGSTITPGIPALPRFIYPLGIVYHQSSAEPAPDYELLEETAYAVVIDVISPGNPVWLVYNRYPYDNLAGTPVFIDPATSPAVFPGVSPTNFDYAQALSSLRNWNVGALPSLEEFQALAGRTKGVGAVSPNGVLISDLTRALASPSAAPAA